MKPILILFLLATLTSCIPVKVAPKFKNQDYKIAQAKKFKRKLNRETSFIFKDPKNEGEFYDYINTKYELNGKDVGINTPVLINDETLYFSFTETDKEDKSINLPLVAIDLKRQSNGNIPLFENNYVNRKGHWYILITVYDSNLKNCLLENSPNQKIVIDYLKALKKEYLNTSNYNEVLFNKKQ